MSLEENASSAEPEPASTDAWKQRFDVPVVAWTELADNNMDRGLAVSNRTGVFQLYAWDVRTGSLRPLTDEPTGKKVGQISPDGKYIYYLKDERGNEIGHFVRVPFEGGPPEDVTPDLPAYSSQVLAFCRGGPRLAFTLPERGHHRLYRIDESPPRACTPHELWSSTHFTTAPVLSFDGRLAAVACARQSAFQHYSLLLLDAESGEELAEVWDGPGTSLIPDRFSPIQGDARLLCTSKRGGFTRPLLWNATTGERMPLPLDDLEGDVRAEDWSDDGKHLLLVQQARARQQFYTYDLTTDRLAKLEHPPGTFEYFGLHVCYFAVPGEIWCQWQDSTHPTCLIALSDRDDQLLRTVLPSGPVPPGHPLAYIEFSSSDGQVVQGWLGMPDGEGPFPTVIEMHGGPAMAQMDMFSPRSQAWLDAGYAFLTINYRGSVSFGRSFEEQVWGDEGHWEVEDIVAARSSLVDKGIAQAAAIFLTGWSYGGYLTLLTLGKRPELFAGGMAGHVITDWAAQYETCSDRMRGYMVAMFGGTPAEKPDLYRRASPITYVEDVRAPVLIIQASMFAERLQKRGAPVEVHWAEGGHGAHAGEKEIQHQELMMRFAGRIGDGERRGVAGVPYLGARGHAGGRGGDGVGNDAAGGALCPAKGRVTRSGADTLYYSCFILGWGPLSAECTADEGDDGATF